MGKWTVEDIPHQNGDVAIVTGANSGLGLETAQALAGAGAHVVLAVRSMDRGNAAMASIRGTHRDASLELQELDLASLESVRTAASELKDRHGRVDLLINNAGVMYTPWQTTEDGFEMQMGVNHLGHFALTNLLLDRLMDTEGSRVVNVSSVAHKIKSKLDPETMSGEKYDRIAAYGRSKLANLLFTYELQRRLGNAGSATMSVVAHPGGSSTELVKNSPGPLKILAKLSKPFMQSAAMGALPQLRAATDPMVRSGEYYGPDGFMEIGGHPVLVESSDRSHERELQQLLWVRSEELTGESYPI